MTSNSLTAFVGSEGGVREGEKREEVRGEEGEGEGMRRSPREEVGDRKASSMSPASVSLPEVQRVTGEEGEKKIVQVKGPIFLHRTTTIILG